MHTLADIAIVGYGPVGQCLALLLLQRGYKVVVIERWPDMYGLPRAVGFDHEISRILQSAGIAEAMQPHTCAVTRYEWRNGAQQVLLAFPGLDEVAVSGWPQGTGFYQPALEAALDRKVRAFPQAEVWRGWEALAAEDGNDSVRLTVRSTGTVGSETHIHARYVIGCDGADSSIRRVMGSRYEDLGFAADWLVADIRPKDPAAWNSDLIQLCDPNRPTTLVASGPGRRRLEFMLLQGEHKAAMNTPDTVWRLLAAQGWTPDTAELERHAVYTFRACVATDWRAGRLLLAGDAAHLTPPFAAQGLCAGLRDAVALAWRLDQVLRGTATPILLDTYGPERAGHVRRLIEFAIALGQIICIQDPAEAAARDDALRSSPDRAPRYPELRLGRSLLLRAGDPHAGELALQGRVQVGDRVGRFDDVVGRGFMLLGFDHDPAERLTAAQRRFAKRIGMRSVSFASGAVQDIDGRYRRWFAAMQCRAVLVRPDFHIFGAGEPEALVAALQACPVWRVDAERAADAERAVEEGAAPAIAGGGGVRYDAAAGFVSNP